jgi:hypothetical protein
MDGWMVTVRVCECACVGARVCECEGVGASAERDTTPADHGQNHRFSPAPVKEKKTDEDTKKKKKSMLDLDGGDSGEERKTRKVGRNWGWSEQRPSVSRTPFFHVF